MKTENDVLALFLQTIANELAEQRGIPYRFTCRYAGPADPAEQTPESKGGQSYEHNETHCS